MPVRSLSPDFWQQAESQSRPRKDEDGKRIGSQPLPRNNLDAQPRQRPPRNVSLLRGPDSFRFRDSWPREQQQNLSRAYDNNRLSPDLWQRAESQARPPIDEDGKPTGSQSLPRTDLDAQPRQRTDLVAQLKQQYILDNLPRDVSLLRDPESFMPRDSSPREQQQNLLWVYGNNRTQSLSPDLWQRAESQARPPIDEDGVPTRSQPLPRTDLDAQPRQRYNWSRFSDANTSPEEPKAPQEPQEPQEQPTSRSLTDFQQPQRQQYDAAPNDPRTRYTIPGTQGYAEFRGEPARTPGGFSGFSTNAQARERIQSYRDQGLTDQGNDLSLANQFNASADRMAAARLQRRATDTQFRPEVREAAQTTLPHAQAQAEVSTQRAQGSGEMSAEQALKEANIASQINTRERGADRQEAGHITSEQRNNVEKFYSGNERRFIQDSAIYRQSLEHIASIMGVDPVLLPQSLPLAAVDLGKFTDILNVLQIVKQTQQRYDNRGRMGQWFHRNPNLYDTNQIAG